MNALTLHELRLKQAELAERAERLRQEWRHVVPTSNKSLELGRRVKTAQERADDYTAILDVLMLASGKEAP